MATVGFKGFEGLMWISRSSFTLTRTASHV